MREVNIKSLLARHRVAANITDEYMIEVLPHSDPAEGFLWTVRYRGSVLVQSQEAEPSEEQARRTAEDAIRSDMLGNDYV